MALQSLRKRYVANDFKAGGTVSFSGIDKRILAFQIRQKFDKERRHMFLNDPQRVFLFALTLILASGCATTSTGAIVAGPDTFVVSRQAGAFPSGREPLLAEALAEAASTCASLKRALKVISATENPGPYIFGNYPKATVMFSCT